MVAVSGDFSAFDPWFVSSLSITNGLAVAYIKKGRLSIVEKLFKQALKGCKKASGPKASKTLKIVNHLGILKTLKGNVVTAERLLLRALTGIEEQYAGHRVAQCILPREVTCERCGQARCKCADCPIKYTME